MGTTPTGTRAGMWVVEGNCAVDSALCVTSPNFPSLYGDRESCRISVDEALAKPVVAKSFDTESEYDILKVNDREYSGTLGPDMVLPTSPITWSSDIGTVKSGWRLCPVDVRPTLSPSPRPTLPPAVEQPSESSWQQEATPAPWQQAPSPIPWQQEPSYGEQACIDSPIGWLDSNRDGCSDYKRKNYCANGRISFGWSRDYGPMSAYSTDGISALEACCVCRSSNKNSVEAQGGQNLREPYQYNAPTVRPEKKSEQSLSQSGNSADESSSWLRSYGPPLGAALCSMLLCVCCYRRRRDGGFNIMSPYSRDDYGETYGRRYFRDDGI